MDLRIDTSEDVHVVTLTGEVDGKTAPEAQQEVVPLCTRGAIVLIDLSGVTFLSSAGLRLLLLLYRQSAAGGARLALVGVPEDLQDTMSATGFLSHFRLYGTVATARADLTEEGRP